MCSAPNKHKVKPEIVTRVLTLPSIIFKIVVGIVGAMTLVVIVIISMIVNHRQIPKVWKSKQK